MCGGREGGLSRDYSTHTRVPICFITGTFYVPGPIHVNTSGPIRANYTHTPITYKLGMLSNMELVEWASVMKVKAISIY